MTLAKPDPTPEQILALPYVDLLALISESNRPPGGNETMRKIIVNCHLRPGTKVLHAGCNAGYLSRQIARLSGSHVRGIDISPQMAEAAQLRAAREGLSHLVQHEAQDMRKMRFPDGSFDVVLSGGALAFVRGQRRAVEEWVRVVRPYGFLADSEMYYRVPPPDSLRTKVSEAIGVDVPVYDESFWERTFDHDLLEPYYRDDGPLETRQGDEIEEYVLALVSYSVPSWQPLSQEALRERLLGLFHLFNENMKYLNRTVFVKLRNPAGAEPALFV